MIPDFEKNLNVKFTPLLLLYYFTNMIVPNSLITIWVQNLTEFNTAHNKRISTLTIEEGNLNIQRPKRRRRRSCVSFSDEEEVINPGKDGTKTIHRSLITRVIYYVNKH